MAAPNAQMPQDYSVETCLPAELTGLEMERCLTLVIGGEAIKRPGSVKTWLPRSQVLALVRTSGQIVGIGAIKSPRPRYAEQVAKASGHAFAKNMPELGYIARDPSHRNNRFSPHIIAALLQSHGAGPLWATTSSAAIKAALTDLGFRNHGSEWGNHSRPLSLWLRA
jgi:hypothetical protein